MNLLLKNIGSMLHGIEDYHDRLTEEHECRTGRLMSLLGEAYGLKFNHCELLNCFGAMHDIGKLGVPSEILKKAGPLTPFERKIMELHPIIGYEFIKNIKHKDSKMVGEIILTHHENFDGSGYPQGLKGKEIPIGGSICAICDVYDALREGRPYRKEQTHDEVMNMLYDKSPTGLYSKFNPALMKVFEKISDSIQKMYV